MGYCYNIPPLMSIKKLKMLMLLHNYRLVTFEEQKLYRNYESYKAAMKDLATRGFVEIKRNNGCKIEVKCTEKGQQIGDALLEFAK